MTTIKLNVAELTSLLKGAAEAHHQYEAKLGHPDADWAPWYAERMVEALEGGNGAAFKQGHLRDKDFTPTGIRIEQPYENDRNADSKAMLKAIIKEVFGTEECMIGHHISFEVADKRADGFTYTITQEYPSIDTLIFDHEVAKKLWGVTWRDVLGQLVLEPLATRDALLAKLYYGRKAETAH